MLKYWGDLEEKPVVENQKQEVRLRQEELFYIDGNDTNTQDCISETGFCLKRKKLMV